MDSASIATAKGFFNLLSGGHFENLPNKHYAVVWREKVFMYGYEKASGCVHIPKRSDSNQQQYHKLQLRIPDSYFLRNTEVSNWIFFIT